MQSVFDSTYMHPRYTVYVYPYSTNLYRYLGVCVCVLLWVGVSYMPEFAYVCTLVGLLACSARQRWTE